MFAQGNITTGAPLKASSRRNAGTNVEVVVEAGGDVTLDRAKLRSQLYGGRFQVTAAGNITLLGNVEARGRTRSDMVGSGAGGQASLSPGASGIVTIRKKLDVSCVGGCPTEGSIDVATGCYTDVTGAKVRARPNGSIDLGCSCIHPTGSNVCDGGCVGLDAAEFDPAIPTQLPPCS
jgi:hypothetical protein